ncbi:MAG: hypothetical protein JHC82_00860 [Stenotrophomonas sp.]|nr:hypothetical protein [Stenotrophomonas sp.]
MPENAQPHPMPSTTAPASAENTAHKTTFELLELAARWRPSCTHKALANFHSEVGCRAASCDAS